ncbi:MAG: polysaccharide biosynthesis tyrosine autokinase, partial [Candidatus Hydrogenedentota bacterium]
LKDEYDALSKTYNAVTKRIEEIEIATAAGSKGDNIFIITHARIPTKPIIPRKGLSIALAAFIGLALGIGLCFFVEYFDTTVKTKEDAESVTGVPVIGYVPEISNDGIAKAGNGPTTPLELHLLEDPRSGVAEAFRSIRTALTFSGMNGSLKHFLITSATRGEGKTLTSVNVAIVTAQAGKKVLLVDADMRKPTLHKIFRVVPSPGLSNLLAGEGAANLQDAVQPVEGVDNLSLLPCGPMPPNPAELLGGKSMRELLGVIATEFDVAVFDTPPFVSVTDAAVLSQYVNNVVLVVRSFSTQRETLLRASDIIRETKSKVLGVVLNNVDVPRGSYHNYYYGYCYGYGDDDDAKNTQTRLRDAKDEHQDRHLLKLPRAMLSRLASGAWKSRSGQ